MTDSVKGRIWRIIYTGEPATAARRSTPAASFAAPDDKSRGAQLYQQTCAACHMPDGSGVPGMHPSLAASAVVSGDPSTLIRVVLHGPAQALPPNRPRYATVMPPFGAAFNDADIAETLTFTRRAFGKGASAITPAQVAKER